MPSEWAFKLLYPRDALLSDGETKRIKEFLNKFDIDGKKSVSLNFEIILYYINIADDSRCDCRRCEGVWIIYFNLHCFLFTFIYLVQFVLTKWFNKHWNVDIQNWKKIEKMWLIDWGLNLISWGMSFRFLMVRIPSVPLPPSIQLLPMRKWSLV